MNKLTAASIPDFHFRRSFASQICHEVYKIRLVVRSPLKIIEKGGSGIRQVFLKHVPPAGIPDATIANKTGPEECVEHTLSGACPITYVRNARFASRRRRSPSAVSRNAAFVFLLSSRAAACTARRALSLCTSRAARNYRAVHNLCRYARRPAYSPHGT